MPGLANCLERAQGPAAADKYSSSYTTARTDVNVSPYVADMALIKGDNCNEDQLFGVSIYCLIALLTPNSLSSLQVSPLMNAILATSHGDIASGLGWSPSGYMVTKAFICCGS